MENEYITNINIDDIGEDALLEKIKNVEAELSETKSKLNEKTKLYLDQKHQLEDLFIETKDLKEKYNNQQKLLKFYEDKSNESSSGTEIDPEKKRQNKATRNKNNEFK